MVEHSVNGVFLIILFQKDHNVFVLLDGASLPIMQGRRSEQNDTKDHRKGEDILNLCNITYKLRFVSTNTIKIMYSFKKLLIILKKFLGFK